MNDHLAPRAAPPGNLSFPPTQRPSETSRGRHAPRIPISTRAAAVPKVSLAQRTGEAEEETKAGRRGRGRGWPAFSHVQDELATRGKRPQALEACVGPRPGGMTVRFGHHGLDSPGALAPQPPACPTQHASGCYLQVPAGRLEEEAGPVLLRPCHRHELPQRLLSLRRHLRAVRRPNRSGPRRTASAPLLRSARRWTRPGRPVPAHRPRLTRCLMQSPPCGNLRRSRPLAAAARTRSPTAVCERREG